MVAPKRDAGGEDDIPKVLGDDAIKELMAVLGLSPSAPSDPNTPRAAGPTVGCCDRLEDACSSLISSIAIIQETTLGAAKKRGSDIVDHLNNAVREIQDKLPRDEDGNLIVTWKDFRRIAIRSLEIMLEELKRK